MTIIKWHTPQVLAYQQLDSLQGQYIPHLLAAGTIDNGRTAPLTDAGTSMQDLVLQCDAHVGSHVFTQQVKCVHVQFEVM